MPDYEPGPELDALVATEVMGWHEWIGNADYNGPFPMFAPGDAKDGWGLMVYLDERDDDVSKYWSPSTSIADAWEVICKMQEGGWNITLQGNWHDDWTVSGFAGDPSCPYKKPYDPQDGHGYSQIDTDDDWADRFGCMTAPHAICLAALRAVGALE